MEEKEEKRRGNVIRGGNERDKEKVEGRVCEREREGERVQQTLCPTFLSIFHLNFYVTTLDSRYAPDTLAEPIEIFIPTRLPFQFTYE